MASWNGVKGSLQGSEFEWKYRLFTPFWVINLGKPGKLGRGSRLSSCFEREREWCKWPVSFGDGCVGRHVNRPIRTCLPIFYDYFLSPRSVIVGLWLSTLIREIFPIVSKLEDEIKYRYKSPSTYSYFRIISPLVKYLYFTIFLPLKPPNQIPL